MSENTVRLFKRIGAATGVAQLPRKYIQKGLAAKRVVLSTSDVNMQVDEYISIKPIGGDLDNMSISFVSK